MDRESPRPLTEDESLLLTAMLGHEFPGADELRAQLRGIAAHSSCACGCGSIFLVPGGDARVDGGPTGRGGVPVSGHILDDRRNVVGGVVLWLENGLLSELEVHWNDEPLPVPRLENVEWVF